MFTGLIQDMGKLLQSRSIREGKELVFQSPNLISQMKIDDSVAVNGVCQTVVDLDANSFKVHCVPTSLQKTTLGQLKIGEEVNLELALRMGDRLGGHLVQGHVNGLGQIVDIKSQGNHRIFWIRLPADLLPYTVAEGSIALDGISLTLADKRNEDVAVSIIPHTLQNTNLKNKKLGDTLNVEVDIIAKYVQNFIRPINNPGKVPSPTYQQALKDFLQVTPSSD